MKEYIKKLKRKENLTQSEIEEFLHGVMSGEMPTEIIAEFLERDITRQELADGVWTDLTGQGQSDLTDDPLFLSGWPQVNLQLESTSPGIDAGDNDFCPTEDHLGDPRPVDGDSDGNVICDIGAYEWKE